MKSRKLMAVLILLASYGATSAQSIERQVIASLGSESQNLSSTCGDLVIALGIDSLTNGYQQPVIPDQSGSVPMAYLHALKLFPNPSRGNFTVVSEGSEFIQMQLFSASGQLLVEKGFLGGQRIEVDLPPGTYIYFLRISQQQFTGRLVIIP